MIFVQIAAYRELELRKTIDDCLKKARYPNDLRFGICWQKDSNDNSLADFLNQKNFRIEEIPWQRSRGLGWARSRIQRLYDGETYTIQLDGHHRFVENWDADLINCLESTGSNKPIVTSYAGIYTPGDPAVFSDHGPFKMVAQRFTPAGTIIFLPREIENWKDLNGPIPARFVSGHYFFTIGDHSQEYRYDPGIYFAGDEISLSIRSFTMGYDLFHPNRIFVYHEYTREGRQKHWEDHTLRNRKDVPLAWTDRDRVSKERIRKLLREEENDQDLNGYDLGSARSHRDFELYAGIDFKTRRLQNDTVEGIDPPCHFENSKQWEAGFLHHHSLKVDWKIEDLEKCDDCHFLYIGLEDADGNEIFRYDAPAESDEARFLISNRTVEFDSISTPAKLIIWPCSRSKGWLRQVWYDL